MSLNLNDRVPIRPSSYNTSPSYTDAINDSRFVRSFGMVSVVGLILALIVPAVAIGIGLAVIGFGRTTYYRLLGLGVAVLGFLSPALAFVVLSAGVGAKAMDVLKTLASEGKDDPDWGETRKRTLIGLGLSAAGFALSGIWLIIYIVGSILKGR